MLFLGHAGIKFWKVGSRKVYAIKPEDKGKGKKRMADPDAYEVKDESLLYDKLDAIDTKLSKIMTVDNHLSIPIALTSLILETFRCSICQDSPIVPLAIFARCC